MFILSKIEHTVRLLQPWRFLDDTLLVEAIKGELEWIFLDKIISNLGLVISVYDIQSIDGGFISHEDGAAAYTVKFRSIIFRPFVGEIISAKLIESTADGLVLSIGFFDDIKIPLDFLPRPRESKPDPVNPNLVHWSWIYNEEVYPIDDVDEIRFRVHDVSFPPPPLAQREDEKPFAPMVVIGFIDADGLGPTSWWEASDEEVDDGPNRIDDGPNGIDSLFDSLSLYHHFGSRDSRRQVAKCFMADYGISDKSLAITWLAVHGIDSLCVVVKDEHIKHLVQDLGKYKPVHSSGNFIGSFWNAVVCKIEDIDDELYGETHNRPFAAGSVYTRSDKNDCNAELAHALLRMEIKNSKACQSFTYRKTVETAIHAFFFLFGGKIKVDGLRVFAWKMSENTGKEVQDTPKIKEMIEAFMKKLKKRN